MAVSIFLDPKNDIAFKKIFGSEKNKDILIHFINDIMGFKNAEQIHDVTFLSSPQDLDIAYKKQSLVDVLCTAQDDMQIIVEMQVLPSRGFEKRAQYYAAKAYSCQLSQWQNPDSLYSNLKEVIFIAISDCIVFPDKTDYISHHVILDKITFENDLRGFSFIFIELPKFSINKIQDLQTIIEKWCYFFKFASKTSEAELQRIIGSDLVIQRAYEALNQFNWNEIELVAYEQEIKRIGDNKAADAFMIENAETQGIARGKAEGERDKAVEIAKNLLRVGVNIEFIARTTGLTTKEIELIKSK